MMGKSVLSGLTVSIRVKRKACASLQDFGVAGTSLTEIEAAIRRGLASVEWPARLQRLTRGPLTDALPSGWELWLDGGHNDSAGEFLQRQLINDFRIGHRARYAPFTDAFLFDQKQTRSATLASRPPHD